MQSIYLIEDNDDMCVALDKCQDTPKMSFANNTHLPKRKTTCS